LLESLHIENIAVIERADVDFHDALNVLTGETGAGKSILIDAINAVLGERVRRDLVRTGCDEACVYATFSAVSARVKAYLATAGYPMEDESLLIGRTIRADGRSTCRINGRPATVGVLRDVGRMLVNIHGQHENQSLLDPNLHLHYLEKLGDFAAVRASYTAAYERYCDISRALKKIRTAQAQAQEREDMLRFRIGELEAAELVAGEEKDLETKRDFYRHSAKIAGLLRKTDVLLSGEDDGGAVGAVTEAADALRHAAALVESISPLSERLQAVMYDLEALGAEIGNLAANMDFDEADREKTEDRLALLRRLSQKYGTDAAGMLEILENDRNELKTIETADARIATLEAELEIARNDTVSAAENLTAARKATAKEFEKRVCEELTFLDMPFVQLEVAISPVPLTAVGGDKVEFMLSVNPGEPAKPLANIASGGELSRMMLAMKAVMAKADDIDTLIFDEIDTGISGHAAVKVGIKLRETASFRQILCVTHLAQIAARAHHHLLIRKDVANGRTCTQVLPLVAEDSERELARIIGGAVTDATLKAAKEMRADGQNDN